MKGSRRRSSRQHAPPRRATAERGRGREAAETGASSERETARVGGRAAAAAKWAATQAHRRRGGPPQGLVRRLGDAAPPPPAIASPSAPNAANDDASANFTKGTPGTAEHVHTVGAPAPPPSQSQTH
ncbi:hypothetical protein TcCL_Unassigned02006 [Trypanosoma cruzi]|nr:hypothetical protein TcCL_Unassigned02006 [Trypanosoma cruzi]